MRPGANWDCPPDDRTGSCSGLIACNDGTEIVQHFFSDDLGAEILRVAVSGCRNPFGQGRVFDQPPERGGQFYFGLTRPMIEDQSADAVLDVVVKTAQLGDH